MKTGKWLRRVLCLVSVVLSANLLTVPAQADSSVPSAREYHHMVYDSESDRVILYGGSGLTDTWAYDINTHTWTKMAPAQSPPRGGGEMAYDEQSDRAILFLNQHGWPQPTDALSETWAYDYNTDTWTNMEPENAPPAIVGAPLVYDTQADRIIMFGGLDNAALIDSRSIVFLNDIWVYDFDSNTWTKMEPTSGPSGRNYHVMTYDAAADRVIVFGGAVPPADPTSAEFPWEIAGDTWAYDYNTNTWEALEPAKAPSPRNYSAMVYDAASNQSILFGGVEEIRSGSRIQEAALGDTWAYDFAANAWIELNPAIFPSERGWHGMVFNSTADRFVLFSGCVARDRCNPETWFYDLNANTWAQAEPG